MDEVRDIALGGENGSKSFWNAGMVYKYSFDLKGKMSGEEKRAFCTTLEKKFIRQKFTKDTSIEDIFNNRRDALGIYAGLFFIGIFVGILFLTATVLIIYYKQVSEGYEDRNHPGICCFCVSDALTCVYQAFDLVFKEKDDAAVFRTAFFGVFDQWVDIVFGFPDVASDLFVGEGFCH